MVETTLITATRLREILHYDPESGELRWLISPRYRVNIGALAGVLNSRGYRVIKIGGRMYVAHRLAFLWMEGRWPLRKSTTPMVTKPTTLEQPSRGNAVAKHGKRAHFHTQYLWV